MKHGQMVKRKRWFVAFLFIISLLIKLFSLHSFLVEKYYSNGFYIGISYLLRTLFGWLPFSIGDVLYALAVIWLLSVVIRFIRLIIKKKFTRQTFYAGCYILVRLIFLIYIIFNLFWGLNYDRKGIAFQLALHPEDESLQDLHALADSLLLKVNKARTALPQNVEYPAYKINFSKAIEAYQSANEKYPFLDYTHPSVKASLYGLMGNYLGFSGYYNPFTAEAQINPRMPPFLTPYVTCHEMAHQLGYATEDEANFVGYLAAKSSHDLQFQYSVYFDLFNYTNSELFFMDSSAAKENYKNLDTLVKLDIKYYRHFLRQYRNPLEPLITKLYGNYLKANNQPEGIETYSKVIVWLIAYQKRYGNL